MTTAIQDAQLTALLGRKWTDAKGREWEVRRLSNEEGKVRAVMAKSGRGKDLTPEEVLAEIANDEGDGATNAVSLAAPTDPVEDLVGKSWTEEDGTTWTVTGADPDDQACVIAVDGQGFEAKYLVDEVINAINPTPLDEAPDTSLAGAGAEADEQYRARQLTPGQRTKEPRVLHLPQVVIDGVNAKLRELQGEIGRHGGKGKVALSITVKEGGQSGEYDLKYEVGMTPPKLKTSGHFWDGDELGDTGLPKREPENQTTVFDVDPFVEEPATGATVAERIAADETADAGDAPDANPRPEGEPDDAEKAAAKRAAVAPEGIVEEEVLA